MTLLDDILHRIPETGEVNIVATRKVVPGKQEELEKLLKEMETGTLANDKGCLRMNGIARTLPTLISWLNVGRIGLPFCPTSGLPIWSQSSLGWRR